MSYILFGHFVHFLHAALYSVPNPSPLPSPQAFICVDEPNWADAAGQTCADYVTKQWCTPGRGRLALN